MPVGVSYDFDHWSGKPCYEQKTTESNQGNPKCCGFERCWLGEACDLAHKISLEGNDTAPTKPKQGIAC